MDRRQKKTRQAIYQALTRLLEKKSFSSITVQEIIDEANIGRSTFYSHFETKDDLLQSLCREIFEHVFSSRQTEEKDHDFSHSGTSLNERITHILYHLKENQIYIKSALSCESGEVFMRAFREELTVLFEQSLPFAEDKVPRDYMLNHLVCDFAETVRWWMDHPQYTPEEISSFFFETTPTSF